MTITKQQRIYLMADLWPNACQQQGWSVHDKERRYALFAEVLGHWPYHKRTLEAGGHISCNDFEKTRDRDDFGAVKSRLLLLAAADLRQVDPVKRTRLWIVNSRLIPCYTLYRPEAALTTILRERFNRVSALKVLEDLSNQELEHLIFTLEARINTLRKESDETKHEMCARAMVPCWNPAPDNCKRCWEQVEQESLAGVPALDGGNTPF